MYKKILIFKTYISITQTFLSKFFFQLLNIVFELFQHFLAQV